MALNDYKAGGEADIGRIAAKYGKSKAVVSSTRSKVNKKILQMLTEWEARQPTPAGGHYKASFSTR